MDFSLKFDPITLQNFLDVRPYRLKILVAQNIGQSFAHHLFGSAAGHLQISLADEAIPKVPIQTDKHEGRSI